MYSKRPNENEQKSLYQSRNGFIGEFDGSLWSSMVEFVTVGRNKEITVTFRDGTEIQA